MTAHVVLAPTRPVPADAPAADRIAAQKGGAREALARACDLAGVPLGPLDTDERDAPVPFDGVHWSLTHTRVWVAAAIDTRGPVGVDVEAVRLPRGPRESALDAAERALLGDAPLELAFARCWTAKECVLKVAGVGLLGLDRCRLVEARDDGTCVVTYDGTAHVVSQRRLPGHVLAVCAPVVLWHGLPAEAAEFAEVVP